MEDGAGIVRRGYNEIARRFAEERLRDSEDIDLLGELVRRLPGGGRVLDAGCGSGVPVARLLAESLEIVGVDFSEAQLRLAPRLVPTAAFVLGDLTRLAFRPGIFDAVVSYYAIIHIPRERHRALLRAFHEILRPSGLLLATLGADDLPASVEDDYLGARMYWSHFDAETNLRIVREAGFETVWSRIVPDRSSPGSEHLFVLAQRRPGGDGPTSRRARFPGPAGSPGRS